jgi:hypothetical protein
LQDLKDKTNAALGDMVGVGVEPCKSKLSVSPETQFTSKSITVKVDLNEKNGLPITTGLSETVSKDIASRITPYITFGKINSFAYDGYQTFIANISSDAPGNGSILVAFDNNMLCTDILPSDLNQSPDHTLQEVKYQFIYAPAMSGTAGDSDGKPRRDAGDQSRVGTADGGGKDNV